MRAEGAGDAPTDSCDHRCLASGDDCPGEAIPPAAIDCDKQARGGRVAGEACDASEAIRVGSGRRTRCSSDARETCAANGYGEARADETRDAGADGEARDTAG